jgi:hypothetical protein
VMGILWVERRLFKLLSMRGSSHDDGDGGSLHPCPKTLVSRARHSETWIDSIAINSLSLILSISVVC